MANYFISLKMKDVGLLLVAHCKYVFGGLRYLVEPQSIKDSSRMYSVTKILMIEAVLFISIDVLVSSYMNQFYDYSTLHHHHHHHHHHQSVLIKGRSFTASART